VAEVSTGDARHGRRDNGRRDNGLVAAEYAAAGDVDPRVGEHLLDVLAIDGIAAYLRPSTDLHPVTRQTSLPARPTDRLYVDRMHLSTARDYLARLAEEAEEAERGGAEPASGRDRGSGTDRAPSQVTGTEPDIDGEWAKIVAGFEADVATDHPSWPAAEDLPDGRQSRAERVDDLPDGRPSGVGDPTSRRGQAGEDPPGRAAEATSATAAARSLPRLPDSDQASLLDGLDTFGADLPDADEEGYTPPAPPPVPRPSLPAALGAGGIIGGLLIFLRPDILPLDEGTAMILGFIAIVTGFATLVWRLRPGDEEDIDPDDGARV
jgi:hypothetical protein